MQTEKHTFARILFPVIFFCRMRRHSVYYIFYNFNLQFTRRPSRRLSRRLETASQPDGGGGGGQESNSEVVRSPVMLSSLANGSLKRHPDPK